MDKIADEKTHDPGHIWRWTGLGRAAHVGLQGAGPWRGLAGPSAGCGPCRHIEARQCVANALGSTDPIDAGARLEANRGYAYRGKQGWKKTGSSALGRCRGVAPVGLRRR